MSRIPRRPMPRTTRIAGVQRLASFSTRSKRRTRSTLQAGSAVRRRQGVAADRRPRARHAWRQCVGRPFTGDYAGVLLYQTLFDFGWRRARSRCLPTMILRLIGARLTNAVKCLPPDNKPTPAEAKKCNGFSPTSCVHCRPAAPCSRSGASRTTPTARSGARAAAHPFATAPPQRESGRPAPGAVRQLHCSRYNTNTRRLTRRCSRKCSRRSEAHDGSRR